jgi:hypothetical protein
VRLRESKLQTQKAQQQLRQLLRMLKLLGLSYNEAKLKRMRTESPEQYKKLLKLSRRFASPVIERPIKGIFFFTKDDFCWLVDTLRHDRDVVVIKNAGYNDMSRQRLVQQLVPSEEAGDVRERLLREKDTYKLYWQLLEEKLFCAGDEACRQSLCNYMTRDDAKQQARFMFVDNAPELERRKLLVLCEKHRTGYPGQDKPLAQETRQRMQAILCEFERSDTAVVVASHKRKRED